MSLFLKNDLVGTHYQWEKSDHDRFIGEPSRRIFDRYNGSQVLFLINFIATLMDRFTLDQGKQLEQSLQFDLPQETKSEISVFYWLRENSPLFK